MNSMPRNITTQDPTQLQWSDRLAFELALRLEGSGEPIEDIAHRNGMNANQVVDCCRDATFSKKVQEYRDEISEKGLTFRLKARTQAEALLGTSWLLIHNPDTSPAVKADLIKSTVKWAGLEIKPDVASAVDGGSGGGVNIVINMGEAGVPPKVINAEISDGRSDSEGAHGDGASLAAHGAGLRREATDV